MKEAEQSTRDSRLSTGGKSRSNPCQGGGMRRASGAEASYTERRFPRLKLRRSTRVGAWNVMSLSEVRDKHTDLRLLYVRRPGRGWDTWGGYTYYWSGRPQGHLEGVAVPVADRLVTTVTEATPANERIMRLRNSDILGVIPLVAVYVPTGMSECSVKEAFYAQLKMVADWVKLCQGRHLDRFE